MPAQRRTAAYRVAVIDRGIGMAPEEIPVALTPFQQVDIGLRRKYEGTGLGLPIAKQLMELHGGALTIESARGRGHDGDNFATSRTRCPRLSDRRRRKQPPDAAERDHSDHRRLQYRQIASALNSKASPGRTRAGPVSLHTSAD